MIDTRARSPLAGWPAAVHDVRFVAPRNEAPSMSQRAPATASLATASVARYDAALYRGDLAAAWIEARIADGVVVRAGRIAVYESRSTSSFVDDATARMRLEAGAVAGGPARGAT